MRQILLLIIIFFSLEAIADTMLFVEKQSLRLYVVSDSDTIASYPICLGKKLGQKRKAGDHKTPEGYFSISMIQNSSSWQHDFNDGKGSRKGAYGPWFFRLRTPMSTHIGIHGTCFPESIGTRDSEGCIRMKNEDLIDLHKYVYVGMKVYISKDSIQ